MKKTILAICFSLLLGLTLIACTADPSSKAQVVIDEIVALPEEVTLDDEEAVKDARADYEALSSEAQALVTNLSLLEEAEEAIAVLKETHANAEEVITLIANIPTPVTEESGEAIANARAAYDALSSAAKALVTNYDVLTQAESVYHDLTYDPVAECIALIAMLPVYDEITLADSDAINRASSAYEALSAEEKEGVTNYATLQRALGRIATLKIEAEEARKAEEAARISEAIHNELEEILPTTTSDDIELVKSYEYDGKTYNIRWRTSDGNTMNVYGKVSQGLRDVSLTLTYTIIVNSIKTNFTHDIVVTALVREPLSAGKILSAYLYDGNYEAIKAKDAMTLDIVNYGFAKVGASLVPSVTLSRLDEVLALRKKGVYVVVSIGGSSAESLGYWSDAASTAANRTAFAKACLEMITVYHFDGVDLDWEYPGFNTGRETDVDKANFTLLVKEIRKELDSYDESLILSAAVPGGPWGYTRYNIKGLNDYFDFFNLMTYDMEIADYGTHHTALYTSPYCYSQCDIASTVKIWHNGGADYNKLLIGAAFYGRKFIVSSAGSNYGLKQTNPTKKTSAVTYTRIKNNWLTLNTCSEHYDETAQAAWCYDTASGTLISYDNATSLAAKCDYVNSAGVRGLMFWDYGSDETDTLMTVLRTKRSSLI